MAETLSNLMPWLFAAVLVAGIIYLFASLFLGGLGTDADLDVDAADLHIDALNSGEEALGIGCNVIAAFCVGVGSMGLLGTLSNWNLLLTVLMSLLFGLLLGRVIQRGMRFVLRQQSNDLLTPDRLIGTTARITVNTPAGRIGEALVESEERIKYPAKNVVNEPLNKGDIVVIEEVRAGRLYVRKTYS
jgi:membrane protein implicated in regulation of membrane protease activity